MILVDAVYINSGGGKTLLQELLSALRGVKGVALLRDTRLRDVDVSGAEVFDIPPSEFARARFYRAHAAVLSRVLCFGNVPPPLRLPADVSVYFHNMLICQAAGREPGRRSWRGVLRMMYIRFMSRNAERFLVQSSFVEAALEKRLPAGTSILRMPFYVSHQPPVKALADDLSRWSRYAYVSNAYPHKNHLLLLDAWERLARRGLFPELHLTVSGEFPEVLARIEAARRNGALIFNHGLTQPAALYHRCGYQVYPSLLESFGLSLVEAAESGCAVIASDLPFVRQAVAPWTTFDPHSAVSIAEAVERTCGRPASASEVVIRNCLADLVAWLGHGQHFQVSR